MKITALAGLAIALALLTPTVTLAQQHPRVTRAFDQDDAAELL